MLKIQPDHSWKAKIKIFILKIEITQRTDKLEKQRLL